jgi:DNA-binding XRE family transcriptional regulator
MKTQHRRTPSLEGFTDYEDRVKELKRKKPEVYAALKNPDPLACLAWNVIELRGEKGWSQQELSHKAGVAKRVIAYIESYQSFEESYNASVKLILKIAKALGVPFSRMFQEVDLTKV